MAIVTQRFYFEYLLISAIWVQILCRNVKKAAIVPCPLKIVWYKTHTNLAPLLPPVTKPPRAPEGVPGAFLRIGVKKYDFKANGGYFTI